VLPVVSMGTAPGPPELAITLGPLAPVTAAGEAALRRVFGIGMGKTLCILASVQKDASAAGRVADTAVSLLS